MATSPSGQDSPQAGGEDGGYMSKFFMPFLPHIDDVSMDPREASLQNRQLKKSTEKKTDHEPAAMLKVQKRGELQTYQVALDDIETWDDLLIALQRLFTFTFSNPPSIMTFEGDMIYPSNFKEFMTAGRRLVLAFPLDFKALKNVGSPLSSHSSMSSIASPGSAYSVAFMKKEELDNAPPPQDSLIASWQSQTSEAMSKMHAYAGPRPMSSSMSPMSSPMSPGQGRRSTDSRHGTENTYTGSPTSSHNRQSIFSSMSPTSSSHEEAETPATDPGDNDELNWGFGRDPSLWYPAADKWSATRGKQDLENLENEPLEETNPLRDEIDKVRSRGLVSRMASGFETSSDDRWSRSVRRPSVGSYPSRSPGPAPEISAEDLENAYPIYGTELEQRVQRITVDVDHDMEDAESEASDTGTWQQQIDEIEDLFSSHVILCPHITFHVTKPIRLRIHLTPTISVIPPPMPQEHERFYATSIGENLNLEMSLENNGKITSLVSEPENTKYPAKPKEKITLLKKTEGRGAGGKWHIARTDLQLEGSWGNSEVGQLGGMGDDGKRRNGGSMLDLGFKGKENARRSFALQFDKVAEFIDLFMDTCGFPQRERETMCGFWQERIPRKARKSHVLLVKILPVKDLISVLPIETDPPPDRVIRFFLVMRAVSRKTIKKEGLEVNGVMSAVVREVLGSKTKPIVPATRGRGRGRGGRGRGGATRGGRLSADGNGIVSSAAAEDEENGLTIFEYGACLISIKKAAGQWPGLPAPPPADCDAAEFMKKKDEEENQKEAEAAAAATAAEQTQVAPEITSPQPEDTNMGMDLDDNPQAAHSSKGLKEEPEMNYSHGPDVPTEEQHPGSLSMDEDYNMGYSTDWHRQPVDLGIALQQEQQQQQQQQFYPPSWQPGQFNAMGSAVFNPENFETGPMGGWFLPTAGY